MSEYRSFEGLTIFYDEHWAHIVTDEVLKKYLLKKEERNAKHLAQHILEEYQSIYGKKLKITLQSMMIEILVHVYIDEIAEGLQGGKLPIPQSIRPRMENLLVELRQKTDVIDSGENSVDNNRIVFDMLAPFSSIVLSIIK